MNANITLFPETVAIERLADKHAVLEAVAAQFSAAYDLPEAEIHESLVERENLGSTGFGDGVAIPHARSDKIKRPLASLIRLEAPVDFAAADSMPVELVCGLLSPVNAGATHLHALASLSRLLRDEATREALIDAPDSEALYALLADATDRDVA